MCNGFPCVKCLPGARDFSWNKLCFSPICPIFIHPAFAQRKEKIGLRLSFGALRSLFQWSSLLNSCLVVVCFGLQGCVSPALESPSLSVGNSVSMAEWESADEVLHARDLLPPELLKGEFHTVLDEVMPFRFTHHYFVTSPFGQFEAFGEDMLRIRIEEIQALATLAEWDKYSAFVQGAAKAVWSPFQFVLNFLVDPLETLAAVPKGLWRYATRIEEMTNGERGQLEEGTASELIGFSTVKRQIADRLGVNVYSSNPVLQDKLNRLSWAGYTGNTGIKLLTIPIAGPAGLVLSGTSWSTTIREVVRDYAPEDLRRMNREKLLQMGIDESLTEEFLSHPWYSPRHETILVQSLSELDQVAHREVFLQTALVAEFEEEALFFQRLAEMLAGYHHHVMPIQELVSIHDRLILAYTEEQTLVALVPLAHVPWGKEMAVAVEAVTSWYDPELPVRRVELWTSGQCHPQTAEYLQDKGIAIHEEVMAQLHPPSLPTPKAVVASAPVDQSLLMSDGIEEW